MMIDVTVANTDLDLVALYTHMNPLLAGAALTGQSATELVFTTAAQDRFVISGTGLVWGDAGVLGGAVDAVSFASHGVTQVSFANLQTTGDALWAAMLAEQDGSDPAALTKLLVHHCWTYHGSQGVDYFPETTLAPFGLLNPTGNDKVWLNGGDDVFFTGSAKDTVLGGAGNDQIAGGSENDLLSGGIGADSLFGGNEDDRLLGGSGNDALFGSDGADTLTGGRSDDLLRGGDGADLFVFSDRSGDDVIRDFAPGEDHLQFAVGLAVVMEDVAHGCLLQFGHATVMLQGVTAAELTGDTFI